MTLLKGFLLATPLFCPPSLLFLLGEVSSPRRPRHWLVVIVLPNLVEVAWLLCRRFCGEGEFLRRTFFFQCLSVGVDVAAGVTKEGESVGNNSGSLIIRFRREVARVLRVSAVHLRSENYLKLRLSFLGSESLIALGERSANELCVKRPDTREILSQD